MTPAANPSRYPYNRTASSPWINRSAARRPYSESSFFRVFRSTERIPSRKLLEASLSRSERSSRGADRLRPSRRIGETKGAGGRKARPYGTPERTIGKRRGASEACLGLHASARRREAGGRKARPYGTPERTIGRRRGGSEVRLGLHASARRREAGGRKARPYGTPARPYGTESTIGRCRAPRGFVWVSTARCVEEAGGGEPSVVGRPGGRGTRHAAGSPAANLRPYGTW